MNIIKLSILISFFQLNTLIAQFGVPKQIMTNQAGVLDARLVDIDGDGDLDIISTSDRDELLVWYENNGDGEFIIEHVVSTFLRPRSIDTGDVDNDGDG